MSVVKKYIFVFACIILSVNSWAQAPSPFSTFGLGEPYGNALAHTQGMAGVGVSQPQVWFLNNQNPALLVYNTLTVFQAGIVTEQRSIKGESTSEKTSGGNMNYLVTAFPVKPGKWTTSLGLMPLTSVNYKFLYYEPVEGGPNGVNAEITQEGSGGLSQLYWSNGVRINQNFAVGARINYIFSSIVDSYRMRLPSSANPLSLPVVREGQTYVRDFSFGLGGSFSKDSLWNKNYRLSIGAVYNIASDLNTERTESILRTSGLGQVIDGDTLSDKNGRLYLPGSITFGVSIGRGQRWNVGTEFSYQDWSAFKSVNEDDDEEMGKSWRTALGGELTPDPLAVDSYLKRITYRLGASYEQYPYLADDKPVKDYGATFGFSLPAGRSSLDLAFKFGKRGNQNENLLEESYFRVYFGITFNDQWFVRRKFD